KPQYKTSLYCGMEVQRPTTDILRLDCELIPCPQVMEMESAERHAFLRIEKRVGKVFRRNMHQRRLGRGHWVHGRRRALPFEEAINQRTQGFTRMQRSDRAGGQYVLLPGAGAPRILCAVIRHHAGQPFPMPIESPAIEKRCERLELPTVVPAM